MQLKKQKNENVTDSSDSIGSVQMAYLLK